MLFCAKHRHTRAAHQRVEAWLRSTKTATRLFGLAPRALALHREHHAKPRLAAQHAVEGLGAWAKGKISFRGRMPDCTLKWSVSSESIEVPEYQPVIERGLARRIVVSPLWG